MKTFACTFFSLTILFLNFSAKGQHKITDNIYVDAPVKFANPVWKNIATVKTARKKPIQTFFQSFIPGHEHSYHDNTITNISIGSYKGKPVLFFGEYKTMLFIVDLGNIGSKIVISSRPQTFELQNFFTTDGPYSVPFEKLTGSITLSCSQNAELIFSFEINVVYTPSNKIKQRWSGNNILIDVSEADVITPVPVVDQVYQPLIPVFERYIKSHYENSGTYKEKYFVDGSIWRIKTLQNDSLNELIRIRADCKFQDLKGGDTAWVELIIKQLRVFAVIFYDGPQYLYIPNIDEHGKPLSLSRINEIRALQHQYLSEKFISGISKTSNPKIKCLKYEKKVFYYDKYEDVPVYTTDANGKADFLRYDKKYVGQGSNTRNILVNTCSEPVQLLGIRCLDGLSVISYSFKTITLQPGENGEADFDVYDRYNDKYLKESGGLIWYYYVK